jgi:carboxypeptidase D
MLGTERNTTPSQPQAFNHQHQVSPTLVTSTVLLATLLSTSTHVSTLTRSTHNVQFHLVRSSVSSRIFVGTNDHTDPLGFPTNLAYSYPALTPLYFDRADVKAAMHAPTSVQWEECSGPVFVRRDNSADPIQKVLPQVIEATNRVLVSNANLDFVIMTQGTLLAIQNMTWGGTLGFTSKPETPIVITLPDLQYQQTFVDNGYPLGFEDPQGTMGIQHYERGLMWAETFLSGHMQPQFQPRSSYRHLQWLLGHIEEL